MENGSTKPTMRILRNEELCKASEVSIRSVLNLLMTNLNGDDSRPVIPLGHGDPSAFPCFRTTQIAEDAIADALRTAQFNGYSPTVGILPARSAVAEYLSQELPNKLSPDDVYLTLGCTQAIECILSVLAQPKANILLPRPGFPYYEAMTAAKHIEVRYFDLIPDKDWEVDLEAVEALADENTVAMVVINPGNPCGNVFTHEHLKKVAETAKKLGILVIADEVYDHIAFGSNPFVPMGVFASITPVITLGSISKRWIVPGWRLGWLVTNDPTGILHEHGVADCIKGFLNISTDPPTFIQGAIPQILGKTQGDFFSKILNIIKEAADICYDGLKDMPWITCPSKPEGSMFVMVKINLPLLEDINDDLDFCLKLAKEESVIILPGKELLDVNISCDYAIILNEAGVISEFVTSFNGVVVGLKNWLRITFAIDPSSLEDAIKRLRGFCERHSKKE